jgi:hypothetical protein
MFEKEIADIKRKQMTLEEDREIEFNQDNYINGVVVPFGEKFTVERNKGISPRDLVAGSEILKRINAYLENGGWPCKVYGKASETREKWEIELSLEPFEDENDFPDLFLFTAFDPNKLKSWKIAHNLKNINRIADNFSQGAAEAGG